MSVYTTADRQTQTAHGDSVGVSELKVYINNTR